LEHLTASLKWLEGHPGVMLTLGALSLLMFVGSLVSLPYLLGLIPRDYFAEESRHLSRFHKLHPALYFTLMVLKNLFGLVLILIGLAMLVLPGQGIVTILMGVVLTDFPGKFRFERWLITRPKVLQAVNWLRAKVDQPPLREPSG
jgi:hypothetical protein